MNWFVVKCENVVCKDERFRLNTCTYSEKYLLRAVPLTLVTHAVYGAILFTVVRPRTKHRHQLSLDGFSNCVAVLALDFDTPVSWATCFSDFLDVLSSLSHMSSNFSLISTQPLYFCFLSITSPIVLSLFTKLWIVCLLVTLSSRNLRRNFLQHFPADPYFHVAVTQKYVLL
jgi:ABC-type cobalamin transport system permease subunit